MTTIFYFYFWLGNYLELPSLRSSCAFIFFLFFLELRWAVSTRLEMILPNFILMCEPHVYSSTRNSRIISNRIFVLVWIEFRPWIIWAEIRWFERISLTCCYIQFQLDPRKSWHLNSNELILFCFWFYFHFDSNKAKLFHTAWIWTLFIWKMLNS